jgi:hypothetical protein
VRVDVTVARDDRAHPCSNAGGNVALRIADIDAARRRNAEPRRGGKQRRRMRFRVRRCIAADDDTGTTRQSQSVEQRQRIREALLVTIPHLRPRASISRNSASMSAKSTVSTHSAHS